MSRYIYSWGPRWPNVLGGGFNRKGQSCVVLVRGKMNSCLVEFEDGFRAIVSRNAIRKNFGYRKEVSRE